MGLKNKAMLTKTCPMILSICTSNIMQLAWYCNGNLLPYALSPQHLCLVVLVTSLMHGLIFSSGKPEHDLSGSKAFVMCIMMQLDIKWTSEEECYILNK